MRGDIAHVLDFHALRQRVFCVIRKDIKGRLRDYLTVIDAFIDPMHSAAMLSIARFNRPLMGMKSVSYTHLTLPTKA